MARAGQFDLPVVVGFGPRRGNARRFTFPGAIGPAKPSPFLGWEMRDNQQRNHKREDLL